MTRRPQSANALIKAFRALVPDTDASRAFINQARAMYEQDGVVPPLRIFAKKQGVTTKDLYEVFKKGPMKLICKWGGLPKPTGCV